MKKSCCILMVLLILISTFPALAYGEDISVNFVINGKSVKFPSSPVIRNGVTYVDLKTLSASLSLSYTTYNGHDSVIISNARTSICFVPNDEHATVSDLSGRTDSEYFYRILAAPCIYIDGRLSVAARDIADVFGYPLSFDKLENTVYFGYSPKMMSPAILENATSKAYYFQNQAEFNLPSYGSGYCWATCYAMVISNITGRRITPVDIANINLLYSANGNYCYHSQIVAQYNLRFENALSDTSPYYMGRDNVSGGTYINNPMKNDSVTRAALKEALALNPEGVMVRYADFPHTIVAVAYDKDIILFNDPAPSGSRTYSDTGKYQAVPFSETCVAAKGFSLSDLTFIQAVGY